MSAGEYWLRRWKEAETERRTVEGHMERLEAERDAAEARAVKAETERDAAVKVAREVRSLATHALARDDPGNALAEVRNKVSMLLASLSDRG
jgi:hypothetical protein